MGVVMRMILFFEPLFKEKIWGGNRLKTTFGFNTPSEKTGECWGISAHDEGTNIVRNGPFMGRTLKSLWEEEKQLFGHKQAHAFPILVKIIDADDDLSIQVHPDDRQAEKLGSYGKSECWYILDAQGDTDIIIGHDAKTIDELKAAVESGRVLDVVNRHKINKGDFFYIGAGSLHAIRKGTLLLEVQQSSDITYRFYDYDRLENGKPRPLHLAEALSVVKIPDNKPEKTMDETYFTFAVWNIVDEKSATAHRHGDYLVVLSGSGQIDDSPLEKGDFLMVSGDSRYRVEGTLELARITMK